MFKGMRARRGLLGWLRKDLGMLERLLLLLLLLLLLMLLLMLLLLARLMYAVKCRDVARQHLGRSGDR